MSDGVNKPSMLDARLEAQRLSAKPQKQLIHSIVIVSMINSNGGLLDKRDIGIHYEKVFKACSSKYQGDGPTGILLVYPQHCVHLLEAPAEIINTIIIDLNEPIGSLIQASKILNYSSSLETRFYPQWCYRILNLSSLSKGETFQTNDTIEVTVSLTLEKLYRLGGYLSKQHQMEMKRTLDSLTDKVPQYLPQQDIVDYLTSHDDLITSEQFIKHYYTSHNLTLDSETVWPLPLRLFPYD